MWNVLVFVGLLSHVSGMDLGRKKSGDPGSTFEEYDPDTSIQSINEIILQHTQELLSHLATSCQPEQKSTGNLDGKVFCSENVRIKYWSCRAICERNPSYGERLLCRATMFSRYLSSCFGGNLECVGAPVVTTSRPVMTTRPVNTTPATHTGNCGISNTGQIRIIGGGAVAPNVFPTWQVGLTEVGVNPKNYKCSGSVITKRHILTAASCFTDNEIYNIGFGSDEANPTFTRRQNIVILHPKFNRNTYDYNIAIIELDQSIDFDRTAISPICLPGNDDLRSLTAIVRGWGATEVTGPGTCLENGEACLVCNGDTGDCPCSVGKECTTVIKPANSPCSGDNFCDIGSCTGTTCICPKDHECSSTTANTALAGTWNCPTGETCRSCNDKTGDCPCSVGKVCTPVIKPANSPCSGIKQHCDTGTCNSATCRCGANFKCTARTDVTTLNEARISIKECPEGNRYTNNMLCSEINTQARDTCIGDAGGPVIVDSNGRFEQIGIVSYGAEGCGLAGGNSVYVNVAKFVDWINEKVDPERTFR